eukprot:130427-Rhodomonas_salina.3
MFSWVELSTGPAGEGGLDRISGTHQSTDDKGWGTTHIGLVSRWQRSQGRLTCSLSHYHSVRGKVRLVNAHGRGGEEALDGVALVDSNRSQ